MSDSSGPDLRVCYVFKDNIGHFTQSDAIYHVPLSLARRWRLALLTGGSPRPRGVADLLEKELIVPPGRGWSGRAFNALRQDHAQRRVDVILTGIDEASLLVGWRAQRRLGIPWIAVCEDHPFQSRYDEAGFAGRLERAARVWFLRLALRFPRRLVYFIHPGVLDFLWIKDSIKSPLTNSADLETLEPVRSEIESARAATGARENLIGYVGVVNEAKGGARVLEVFRRVAERVPEARLRLIGRVDEAFRPKLERMLDESGLRGRVEMTGQVGSREALMMAGECAVCLHAYEPRPWLYWNQVLKVLEYMALGVPVVSVDYPGTRSLIGDGVSGVLVPHDEAGAMADAVVRVLGDASLRARLREGGIARAGELSWQKTEQRLYEIVRAVARGE